MIQPDGDAVVGPGFGAVPAGFAVVNIDASFSAK